MTGLRPYSRRSFLHVTALSVAGIAPALIAQSSPAGARVPANWASIGSHGCWGMPDILQDPGNPAFYIVTWQRYRDGENEKVMDVKYSVYNLQTKAFSSEAYLFNPINLKLLQAHPCSGFWRGECRVFYCECWHDTGGKAVEIKARKWSDFQSCRVSDHEKAVTPELGYHPHLQFLPMNDSTAWLFYTMGNKEDKIYYSVCDASHGWDGTPHPVPTAKLIGDVNLTLGTACLEGGDVVIYGSTCEPNKEKRNASHGAAYRFKYSGGAKKWTSEKVIVSGLDDAFKKSGELFVRVIKKNGRYYLSSQSDQSHRYLAEGDDGVHFRVIHDFGSRPALGNAMIGIEGANEILLAYAAGDSLGGEVECAVVPVRPAK